MSELVVLCDQCHENRELALAELKKSLKYFDSTEVQILASFCSYASALDFSLSDLLGELLDDMEKEYAKRKAEDG